MATRIEKVIVDVEVRGDKDLLKLAAASVAADKGLDRLGKTRLGGLAGDLEKTGRAARALDAGGKDIDRFSGRLRLLADTAAIIGPALVPIGALAVPAVAGLAAQAGAAALAGGTMLAAFQGVGGALESVNKAALEPTAENIEAAREAMEKLGPEAQSLVMTLQDFRPALTELRDSAAAGLFPGLERSIGELEGALPAVERLLFSIGEATGGVTEEFAAGLSGPRGQEFLRFLEAEMPRAVTELGQTVANFTAGLGEMWMAFTPLNQDFSGWMLNASRSFDQWAQGLSQTQGFEDFVAYIRTNGPRVADAMSAIGNAVLQIVEAAAPLGGPVLKALEGVANTIATIAGSDAGPAIMATVTALAFLSRGMKTFEAVSGAAWVAPIKGAETFGAKMTAARGPLLRSGAALAGVGIAASGAADGIGLSNTASLALMGTIGGPWGAALGAGVGLMLDLQAASDKTAAAIESANDAMRSGDLDAMLAQREALRTMKADNIGPDFLGIDRIALDGPLAALDARIADTRRGAGDLGDMLVGPLAGGAGRAATSVEELADSLSGLNSLLDRSGSLLAYEQALDDLSASLRENGNVWDRSTEKGRANLEARNRLVETAIQRSETLQEQGDALGAQRILDRAIGDLRRFAGDSKAAQKAIQPFIRELRRLGATEAKPKIDADNKGANQKLSDTEKRLRKLDGEKVSADVDADNKPARRKLDQGEDWFLAWGRRNAKATIDADNKPARESISNADSLGNMLDRQVYRPSVDVDTSGAQGAISSVQSWLNSIQDEIVYVNVQRRQLGGVQKYDTGGFTGWGPRLEPAGVVHRGEVVIPQDRVKRDWQMLKQRYGDLPGFAGGGVVDRRSYDQRTYMPPARSERTTERIVERLPDNFTLRAQTNVGELMFRVANGVVNAQIDHDQMMGGSR